MLQSRPITNLPVQPIEVDWTPPSPAKYVARRQIVENMPDPLCPLFEELYLLRGLELVRPEGAGMVGGGPLFVTVNGYGYMRFDHQIIHDMNIEKIKDLSEEEIEAEDFKMMRKYSADAYARVSTMAVSDVKIFQEESGMSSQCSAMVMLQPGTDCFSDVPIRTKPIHFIWSITPFGFIVHV